MGSSDNWRLLFVVGSYDNWTLPIVVGSSTIGHCAFTEFRSWAPAMTRVLTIDSVSWTILYSASTKGAPTEPVTQPHTEMERTTRRRFRLSPTLRSRQYSTSIHPRTNPTLMQRQRKCTCHYAHCRTEISPKDLTRQSRRFLLQVQMIAKVRSIPTDLQTRNLKDCSDLALYPME